MNIDLTMKLNADSEIMRKVKTEKNAHVIMGHVGTHLDTYEKSEIPIDYFKSEAIIFDVQNIKTVEIKDIKLDLVKENDFVIFNTGRSAAYPYGSKEYFADHPQLSNDLITCLLNKNIRFIGIDCAGIRQGDEHEEADRLAEKHKTYVIENLNQLSQIKQERFTIYTMWLDNPEMTGLRCRVIAELA